MTEQASESYYGPGDPMFDDRRRWDREMDEAYRKLRPEDLTPDGLQRLFERSRCLLGPKTSSSDPRLSAAHPPAEERGEAL